MRQIVAPPRGPPISTNEVYGETGGSLGAPAKRSAALQSRARDAPPLRCSTSPQSPCALRYGFETILPGHQSGGGFRMNAAYGR